MELKEAIDTRRAYRSLRPVEVSDSAIKELAAAASMAPSCFNNQPWRYVFVRDKNVLRALQGAMSKGNEWTSLASMVVAVLSKPELDCKIREREYYQFDTGMATAFMILKATELGLVAHPIAGFSPKKVKDVLGIPEDMMLITLVIVGQRNEEIDPLLDEGQRDREKTRPGRYPFEMFAYMDRYDVK